MNKNEKVDVIRLDQFINEHQIPHIHFMKIDIEGHEIQAFKGLGNYLDNQFIDYIQFEYGGANLDSRSSLMELYKLFEGNGYSIAKIMPKHLEMRRYQPFMDNFQYSNYVAISNRLLEK